MEIRFNKRTETLEFVDFGHRHQTNVGGLLFAYLDFPFGDWVINVPRDGKTSIAQKNTIIAAATDFFLSAVRVSEVFFWLLYNELELETSVTKGFRDNLNVFGGAFDSRKPTLSKLPANDFSRFAIRYSAAIRRFAERQRELREICAFCLDMDYDGYSLNGLTAVQKWFIYKQYHTFVEPNDFIAEWGGGVSEKTIIALPEITAPIEANGDTASFADFAATFGYPVDMPSFIEKYRSEPLEAVKVYAADDILSLMYVEFWHMVTTDARIRQCRNCGGYFIPYSESAEYCARPVSGTDNGAGAPKTCREYAPMAKYRQKVEADELLKIYKNAEAAHYMRHRRTPALFTKKNLYAWKTAAKQSLEAAQQGALSAEELRAVLR